MSQSLKPVGGVVARLIATIGEHLGQAHQRRITELEARVTELTNQLSDYKAQQPQRNVFAIRAIQYLRTCLEEAIGSTAREIRVDGSRLTFALTPVHVTVDPFEQWLRLMSAVPTSNPMEPLRLQFDANGHLSQQQMLLLRGYIAELEQATPQSEFWTTQSVA